MKRAATRDEYAYLLTRICKTEIQRPTGGSAPLGEWRVTDIVRDTILRFREARRGQGTGIVGTNRYLSRLRSLFNWGIRAGYVDQTPFHRHGQAVVRLSRETPRSRRLDADHGEETTLLAACGPHLRAVVECALESGLRKGEILSLQWQQIEGMTIEQRDGHAVVVWAPRAELVLPAAKTKTRRDRRIPISTRLRAILELRRCDPAEQPMPGDAYVFGSAVGTRVLGFGRAWHTAVLRSHGVTPTYLPGANLDGTSRAALARINLHFHDLRREAGSRWLEGGVPLHTVRDWLGHTSIAQTSTYLAGTMKTQHDAMRRFEAHQADLQRLATDAGTGGRKRPRTAPRRDTKPSKSAVGRNPAIM